MFDVGLLNQRRFGDEEHQNVATALKTGKLSEYFRNPLGGPWVQAFEQDLAKYHGVPYAVACSNGTSALHMALEAVMTRMGRGNESKYDALQTAVNLRLMPLHDRWRYVVTTPYSFIATASSILMAGCEPFFIDVDADSYTIPSRKSVGREIPRECRIILPVHLLGHACDMDWIRESGTWDYIIEDNAQGLGAKYKGELCGTLGDISTCSFQFTKTITTMGEGGAVLTKDPDLYQRLIQLRSHGSQYSDSPFLTYNYRMTEPQAAFGLAQLRKLDGFLTVQRQNAQYILNHLPRGLKPPKISKDVEHSFFLIPTIFDEEEAGMSREEFLKRCTDAGVNQNLPGASVSSGYAKPLYEKPLLHRYRPVDGCPNVEAVMQRSVWLDIHRFRTLSECREDLETISNILEERSLNA